MHREQNPKKGIFFNPKSALNLAEKLEECFFDKSNRLVNKKNCEIEYKEAKKKTINFAMNFEEIILEASKIFNNR